MGGDYFKEAVAEFVKRRGTVKPITAPELVLLFLDQKTKNTKANKPGSADYIKDIKARLGRFSSSFQCPLLGVTADMVTDFLDGLDAKSSRTRFNYARLLRTLFRFAQSRKFLAK